MKDNDDVFEVYGNFVGMNWEIFGSCSVFDFIPGCHCFFEKESVALKFGVIATFFYLTISKFSLDLDF